MIYLVPSSMLKENILREVHDAQLVGNHGYLKTYRKVRQRFSWKVLKGDIIHYLRECMTFQQNKSKFTHLARFPQPLSILEQKSDIISMEFITGLPKVQGRDSIYMVMEILTKYACLFSIPT